MITGLFLSSPSWLRNYLKGEKNRNSQKSNLKQNIKTGWLRHKTTVLQQNTIKSSASGRATKILVLLHKWTSCSFIQANPILCFHISTLFYPMCRNIDFSNDFYMKRLFKYVNFATISFILHTQGFYNNYSSAILMWIKCSRRVTWQRWD